MNKSVDNIYREPGELVDLLPRPQTYLTPAKVEQLLLLIAFAEDCIDPERFGHAVSDEVRARASRILKHAR